MRKKSPILYLILINLVWGCTKKTNDLGYEEIESYFAERQKQKIPQEARKLFILSRSGCISCNKSFAELITYFLQDKSSMILITHGEPFEGIPEFNDNTYTAHIYYDHNIDQFPAYNKLNKNQLLYLSDLEIDTLIPITAEHLLSSMQYVNEREQLNLNLGYAK